MTEETVKRGPGRPPKATDPVPTDREVVLKETHAALAHERERVVELQTELEQVRAVAAAESAGVADLVTALKHAHSLFVDLRVTAGLGYTTNKRIDDYLASFGHLIGRE